jgi:hypothetical protein
VRQLFALSLLLLVGCSVVPDVNLRVQQWEDSISGGNYEYDVDDAVEFRKNHIVGVLSTAGAAAIAIGVAALLFGSFINISKLTSIIVIVSGVCVAVSAPWLVDLTELKWVILGLAILLCLDGIAFVAIKTWRALKPNEETKT